MPVHSVTLARAAPRRNRSMLLSASDPLRTLHDHSECVRRPADADVSKNALRIEQPHRVDHSCEWKPVSRDDDDSLHTTLASTYAACVVEICLGTSFEHSIIGPIVPAASLGLVIECGRGRAKRHNREKPRFDLILIAPHKRWSATTNRQQRCEDGKPLDHASKLRGLLRSRNERPLSTHCGRLPGQACCPIDATQIGGEQLTRLVILSFALFCLHGCSDRAPPQPTKEEAEAFMNKLEADERAGNRTAVNDARSKERTRAADADERLDNFEKGRDSK